MLSPRLILVLLVSLFLTQILGGFKSLHTQSANKYDLAKQMGFDVKSPNVRKFLIAIPFIYFFKDDLGIGHIFDKIGVTSLSSIVQI